MQAFMYCAALWCGPCVIESLITQRKASPAARDMAPAEALAQIVESNGFTCESDYDSDDLPKGPYADGGGEADTPQHCDACGGFLENPLTAEGLAYVREAIERDGARVRRAADWSPALFPDLKPPASTVALDTWAPFYAAELREA